MLNNKTDEITDELEVNFYNKLDEFTVSDMNEPYYNYSEELYFNNCLVDIVENTDDINIKNYYNNMNIELLDNKQ